MTIPKSTCIAVRHTAQRPLVLRQRTTVPKHDKPILFQESCLGLSDDQSKIVLRRYFERYSPSGTEWVEYAHTIPTADLIHWIMIHGQLRVEGSEDTSPAQASA